MNIQVGNKYKTRNGGLAVITADVSDIVLDMYQFRGDITDINGDVRLAYFTSNGRYCSGRESQFDLVA